LLVSIETAAITKSVITKKYPNKRLVIFISVKIRMNRVNRKYLRLFYKRRMVESNSFLITQFNRKFAL